MWFLDRRRSPLTAVTGVWWSPWVELRGAQPRQVPPCVMCVGGCQQTGCPALFLNDTHSSQAQGVTFQHYLVFQSYNAVAVQSLFDFNPYYGVTFCWVLFDDCVVFYRFLCRKWFYWPLNFLESVGWLIVKNTYCFVHVFCYYSWLFLCCDFESYLQWDRFSLNTRETQAMSKKLLIDKMYFCY